MSPSAPGRGAMATAVQPVGAAPPRLWLLLGDKLGDNAQIESLARALGWPCARKRLRFLPGYVRGKPRFGASLHHLDLRASDPLEPPWPDAVLTIGRRPSMAALWLRERSQGRCKLVLVGRPKGRIEDFDLVIATPQYGVPDRENVLRLKLPLMRVEAAELAAARDRWRSELAALDRPLTAVLIGGPTGPYRFDAAAARRLFAAVRHVTSQAPGSCYFCTSRRTPAAFVSALEAVRPASARLYRWSPESGVNPYHGLLALADRFVVTGDSLSMIVEAARLGRPLLIYDPPKRRFATARLVHEIGRRAHAAGSARRDGPLARLAASGLLGYARDLGALHRALFEAGLARPLGDGFAPPAAAAPDELPLVVERVRALFPFGAEG